MGCYFKMNKLLPKKKLTLNRVDRFGRVFCDLKQSYSDTNIRLIRMIDLSPSEGLLSTPQGSQSLIAGVIGLKESKCNISHD